MHDSKGISGHTIPRRKCYGRRILSADRKMPAGRIIPPRHFNLTGRISSSYSPYDDKTNAGSPTQRSLSYLSTTTPDGSPSPRPRTHHEFRLPLVPSKYDSNYGPMAREREIPSFSTFVSYKSAPSPRLRIGIEKENEPMTLNVLRQSPRMDNSPGGESTLDSRLFKSLEIPMTSGTVGLVNLGNTCFMNSAIQCIAHTPSLAEYFLSNRYLEHKARDDKLTEAFAGVVRAIYQKNEGVSVGRRGYATTRSKENSSFRPHDFLDALIAVAPQFEGSRQHDCHEFIRVLIDQLSQDLCTNRKNLLNHNRTIMDLDDTMPFMTAAKYSWKQHLSKNSSFLTNEFCGQLVSTLECSVCKTKRYSFDPYYDLSIPFPEPSEMPFVDDCTRVKRDISLSSRYATDDDELSRCTLEDCLRAFTKPEVLTNDNMPECSICQQKRECTKRLQVFRFPRVLVLHLKRFDNSRKKIRTSVDFPVIDFDASTLAIDDVHNVQGSTVYDLFGTCDHSGRLSYGHYTAMCIDPLSGLWYRFNDGCVTRTEVENIDNDRAYVLFYKQRER
eukprot:CCRYP_006736-RA/>CCRYP_006736-RA protein AED:0.04 eAED:0.04 QI:83/1/0.66/1/1/1/3/0/555